MPVIGRLDKQVDDILITPVGNRSSREDANARMPGDDPESARDESHAHERDKRERGERAREDRRAHDESLPVGLL